MLSAEEQKKLIEEQLALYSRLRVHQWHYALERLGLKGEIETVYEELKSEGIASGNFRQDEKSHEVYIPIVGGEVTLHVDINPVTATLFVINKDSFTLESYEISYFIKHGGVTDKIRKTSEILKKHKYKSLHGEPHVIPTPFK